MNIGSLVVDPPVLLAPLAGISNLPFRVLNRRYGCALAFTEMISATGLVRNMRKTFRYLATAPEDRPLGVQLFGTDPGVLAAAAEIVAAHGADLIDLNMGCPVKKVVRTGAGAALMKNPALAFEIMKAVRRATGLPLTVKIRSGWSDRTVNALELARLAAEAGLDAVIVHPRTVAQGFGGRADWRIIADVKRELAIPVVGNGDIRHPRPYAARMRAETGCDGVMVGRGAPGEPLDLSGDHGRGGRAGRRLARSGRAGAGPTPPLGRRGGLRRTRRRGTDLPQAPPVVHEGPQGGRRVPSDRRPPDGRNGAARRTGPILLDPASRRPRTGN